MKYRLSVIIPTLDNVEGIRYLTNYFKKNKDCQIIIVDNNPAIKKFKVKDYPNIVYLPQEKNLGYAKANNLATKYAKADWLLLLNDDIEMEVKNSKLKKYKTKDPLMRLLNYAKDKNLDAVVPLLVDKDGRIENYGYQVLPYGKVQLFKRLTDLRVDKLDGLTAACLLIKKKVFEKLGGFDEGFFAYLEDVEFFLRLKKNGYRFFLALDIFVFHHHQKTSSKMGWFKEKQDFVNWFRIYFKHPDILDFSPAFLMERLRNFWGMVKKFKGLKVRKLEG